MLTSTYIPNDLSVLFLSGIFSLHVITLTFSTFRISTPTEEDGGLGGSLGMNLYPFGNLFPDLDIT